MLNKRILYRLGYVLSILLFIVIGCTPGNVKYGYPTDTLHPLNIITYDNIEDLVLFTYVPDEAEARQTVVVNTKTKKQYKFDDPAVFDRGFYDVSYVNNKMVIPDNEGNIYVLYTDIDGKNHFNQIFTATSNEHFIGIDETRSALVVNDIKRREIRHLNLDGELISVITYPSIGDYDDTSGELLGYFLFNAETNNVLFWGKEAGKDNQLFVLNADSNVWHNISVLSKTDAYVGSASYSYKNYFVLYVQSEGKIYFTDLRTSKVNSIAAPIQMPYDAKINNGHLESVHDNSLIFSSLNLEPNDVKVNESYNFNQIIKEGTQRANFVNANKPNELVFMTPDGLYVYNKQTKELETIIFMDANNR